MVQISPDTFYALNPPSEPAKLTRFLYFLVVFSVIGAFLFGYDTSIISSAMLYLKNSEKIRPVNHVWQEVIVAAIPAFAGIGALIAGPLSDRIGRKKVIMISSVVYTLGTLVCASAMAKVFILLGRILLGFAVGLSSMTIPVYLSESTPAHVRGKFVAGFNLMINIGQVVSNIMAGLLAFIDPENLGWRLMFACAAIPAIVQFIGFFSLPESPRWLFKNRGEKQSREVLEKLLDNDEQWVKFQLVELQAIEEEDRKSHELQEDTWVLWKIWKTPHVRKALLIGCALQAFQQLSAINTVMYYTGTIIKSAGVRDNHTTIWLAAVVTGLNCGDLVTYFIIEKVGRRKILLWSVFGVSLSLALLGTAFLFINLDSAKVPVPGTDEIFDKNVKNFHVCAKHSNCDYCVTDDRCGFCSSPTQHLGYCLPLDPQNSDKHSSTGYCLNSNSKNHNLTIYGRNFEWMDVYCRTGYTIIPVILMCVYLLCFSVGFGPMPWVLNAEFYPLWARGTCVAITTFTNWAFDLTISLTFLTLTEVATKYGTFYIYTVITFVAFWIFWRYIPETKGCSLDEVEMLFMSEEEREIFQRNIRRRVDEAHLEMKSFTN